MAAAHPVGGVDYPPTFREPEAWFPDEGPVSTTLRRFAGRTASSARAAVGRGHGSSRVSWVHLDHVRHRRRSRIWRTEQTEQKWSDPDTPLAAFLGCSLKAPTSRMVKPKSGSGQQPRWAPSPEVLRAHNRAL
jgi:hypothetical protein